MGNVIQFKQTSSDAPAKSIVQSHLDAYLLALARIEFGKAQIETDIRVVESVVCSTENPNLREITLQQLTDIKNQLSFASLKLLDAERGLLGLAASTGMADTPARIPLPLPTLKAQVGSPKHVRQHSHCAARANSTQRPNLPRVSTHQGVMERRAIPRKPVLMSGAIKFAGGAINCLICEMSISGAAVEVADPHEVPERFNLFFKADGTHIPCHLSGANRCGSAWPSTSPRRSRTMSQIGHV